MEPLRIFYSYAAQDNDLRITLDNHLALLRQEGLITTWHDRLIQGGQEWSREIDAHLEAADIILLLISEAFLASDYCYGVEMKRALKRHEEGSARVIPIILRHVDWFKAPFGSLQALPTKGEPIVGGRWHDVDEAFSDAARSIRRIVEKLLEGQSGQKPGKKPAGPTHPDAQATLAQLLHDFQTLRSRISAYWRLRGSSGFTLQRCEDDYRGLYARTLVFLAHALPVYAVDNTEGFVASVQRRAALELQQRSNPSVALARWVLAPLATFEKLAAQVDACTATLESYMRKHFPASEQLPETGGNAPLS
ncbi:MAG TPA: toll/interleukin-1 receptor domain-containing protein [Ktedonobacteraceae bacterium]|jgi:hypothetical protein